MSYDSIIYGVDDRIALITLNHPEAGNAINARMAIELREVCQSINQEEAIRAVIITGAGDKAFCNGADLREFFGNTNNETSSLEELSEFILYNNITEAVRCVQCPVIAAINGDALGMGLALTLSCDLRLASDKSLLGVPDVAQGYLIASGINQWLPRIVGRAKALEMILTAESIDAREAHRIGLVHKVIQHGEVISEAKELAKKMASGAPIALRYAKEAVHKGLDMTLEQGLRLECDLYMILHTTEDRTEGIRTFLEKRIPHFKGE
jgi:enoyl-CoA hydratase/carnithine racemase